MRTRGRSLGPAARAVLCLLGPLLAAPAAPGATTYPSGFVHEVVAQHLDLPTNFAFLPDGRILVTEKSGRVRLIKDGVLQGTPFIDLRSRVNDFWDHGLLGIAVDPDFAQNGHVYLLYTYENDPGQFTGTKTGRLTRVTAAGDTASPATEVVILGTRAGRSCSDFPAGADCLPSESPSHSVGDLRFESDGILFVTTGDGASFTVPDPLALRSQSLDSLGGKVLRITRTGQGVPGNPFWNGDPGANRSKVWAYGLRNPYRFSLRPGTGVPYLGDVGWGVWEEVNVAPAGANLGWPCYEGSDRTAGYRDMATCQALYAAGGQRQALVAWNHGGGSAAATGGPFYEGGPYPQAYHGAYFYADYSQSWIRRLRTGSNDQLVAGSLTTFATEADGPVALRVGPDGLLYYLALNAGQLRRVLFTLGNTSPTAVASATPLAELAPLTVTFSSAGSTDPDGDALAYQWEFGDGGTSSAANPQHTYVANGTYLARLTVSDRRGGIAAASVTITVGNRFPAAAITRPSPVTLFRVGDTIKYTATATDPDEGTLPDSAFAWHVLIHHCPGGECHLHSLLTSTGRSGKFKAPDHGDEHYFEIVLTVTDEGGLAASTSVEIHPRLVPLTLRTLPDGLEVALDAATGRAPLTVDAVVNSIHSVAVASPQGSLAFSGWTDGGPQLHTVKVGSGPVTHVAVFDCPAGQFRADYFPTRSPGDVPVTSRCETGLSHDWGTGGPGAGVGPVEFSVRWTGRVLLAQGRYAFTARADDGVRVYLDGRKIIDRWSGGVLRTGQATRTVSAGEHRIVVEYRNREGPALVEVGWTPAP